MFAAGKGVKNADQKKALLLHTAGLDIQDIYFTLEEEGGSDNYRNATATLTKYFKPQANVLYERLCFRETSQLANETVEQFVTRLRQKAKACEFEDAGAVEEQIRDQVINKCLSHELRRKLLQKGQALTLQRSREIARAMEESEKQAHSIEAKKHAMPVTRLIVWVERWITKKIRAQGTLNVFVVEMWDTKLTITDAQLEGNSAGNVMGQDILRLYVKQRGSKIMAEAEELEECVGQATYIHTYRHFICYQIKITIVTCPQIAELI